MRNMVESNNMMEDIDGGNFFDQIDDLLDFPADDVDSGIFGSGAVDVTAFPPIWSEDSTDFSAGHTHSPSDLSAELSVPYEDIAQLEWLSTFVEDSFSGGGLTVDHSQSASYTKDPFRNQFQTSSPISVLESSSNSVCSIGKTLPVSHEKRARSKRPRPATFTPRGAFQLIAPASSSITGTSHQSSSNVSSESENYAESYSFSKGAEQQKKKRKIKILPPSGRVEAPYQNQNQNQNENQNENAGPVRKCMHCEITKTPQWRAGPMGPKTLCNACGVRYKSGRLFPEYRPAASPTFSPVLHSNSHKKVLEMRGIPVPEGNKPRSVVSVAAPASHQVELISKSDLIPPYM